MVVAFRPRRSHATSHFPRALASLLNRDHGALARLVTMGDQSTFVNAAVGGVAREGLLAFQQLEDNLALLHHFGDESVHDNDALDAAQRTLDPAMSRYKDGMVSHLDGVTAQTTADARIASSDVHARRLTSSVGLIQALGGGWQY